MRKHAKVKKVIKRKPRTIKKRVVENLDEALPQEEVSFDYHKRQESIIALAKAVKPRVGWTLFDLDESAVYSVVSGKFDDIGAVTKFMSGEDLSSNYRASSTVFTGDEPPASLMVHGQFKKLVLPTGEFVMAKPFEVVQKKRSRLSRKRKSLKKRYRSASSLVPELPKIDVKAFDRAIARLRAKSN